MYVAIWWKNISGREIHNSKSLDNAICAYSMSARKPGWTESNEEGGQY